MKRKASCEDDPLFPSNKHTHYAGSLLDLPISVLENVLIYMEVDDLLLCSMISKMVFNLVDERCRLVIQWHWKSNLSGFEPDNGSWRVQLFHWSNDFSGLMHALTRVTWCVQNGADMKLDSLLNSPPPFRRRMQRIINPPTILRMEDSPLHYACIFQCVEIVEVLLSYEVSKECLNKHAPGVLHGITTPWTPLHYAISFGHTNIVKLLIANGADPHLNKGVMSPIQFAQLCGKPEIKTLLSTHAK